MTEAVAAPEANVAATQTAPPAAYDWNSAGLNADQLNIVNDRQWKTPTDVVESYRNLVKLTGVPAEKIIKLPTDNDPTAWNDVYTKLGRPDTSDKYDIPIPEGQSDDFAKTAREWFHKSGLSVAQAKGITEAWNEHVSTATKAQETQSRTKFDAEVNSLKAEWGSGYESNALLVDRAALAFGMDQDTLSALKTTMGPAKAMKFLHAIGSKVAVPENGLINGQVAPGFSSMTPASAQAKISELRASKTFAQQFASADPKVRSEARDTMTRLHQIAFPA